jgi:hypothetical protein
MTRVKIALIVSASLMAARMTSGGESRNAVP